MKGWSDPLPSSSKPRSVPFFMADRRKRELLSWQDLLCDCYLPVKNVFMTKGLNAIHFSILHPSTPPHFHQHCKFLFPWSHPSPIVRLVFILIINDITPKTVDCFTIATLYGLWERICRSTRNFAIFRKQLAGNYKSRHAISKGVWSLIKIKKLWMGITNPKLPWRAPQLSQSCDWCTVDEVHMLRPWPLTMRSCSWIHIESSGSLV